ncbi:hypothetical protein [Desulfovibrio sp. UCD-KL4C]|nr:hypothetical protein [Desulfovibrio sp. UCD-KL4C]
MTQKELIERVYTKRLYRTRKTEVETIVSETLKALEADTGVQLVKRDKD